MHEFNTGLMDDPKALHLVFRKAGGGDLPAIYAIHDECFGQYDLCDDAHRAIAESVDDSKSELIVAEDSPGHIGGFCLSHVVRSLFSREMHVSMLGVTADARRRGLGRAFMDNVEGQARERRAKSVTLSVSAVNEPALGLYNRLGYTEYGRQEKFYPDGSTGIGMEKTLN